MNLIMKVGAHDCPPPGVSKWYHRWRHGRNISISDMAIVSTQATVPSKSATLVAYRFMLVLNPLRSWWWGEMHNNGGGGTFDTQQSSFHQVSALLLHHFTFFFCCRLEVSQLFSFSLNRGSTEATEENNASSCFESPVLGAANCDFE